MRPKVAIIILNWNGWQDTIECLASLARLDYSNYRIILVDNGSTDDSVLRLRQWIGAKSQFEIIEAGQNLGFVGGNNLGLERGLLNGAEYCLMLNNDTTVEPDFLGKLIEARLRHKPAAIASPKIMFYGDRTKLWFAGGNYYPLIKKPFHAYYAQIDGGQLSEIKETSWVSGCCMLIKREVFEKIGFLDKDYFNNYEDVDFCARAGAAGYQIAVVPSSKIYHKFAASMGGKFSPFYTYFRTRNNLLFLKKRKWYLALALNFVIFPIYSTIESLKRRNLQGVYATFTAMADFLNGRYGYGSAAKYQNK